MEVYTLDSLLRREQVVDVFESLIWTERFTAWGDFELVVRSTPAARSLFSAGTQLAINESYYVMTVESVENATDTDGKSMLTLKGRSLEGTLLDSRVVKRHWQNLTTEPNWVLNGTPTQIMTWLFDGMARRGDLNPNDAIPFLQPGSIMPASTLPAPIDPITWTQDPDTLYNALKGLGDAYGIGFRLLRNFDTSQLYFDLYTGSDRTTGQTVLPPVVFSPNLDNLQNTNELTAIDQAKNVAYVFSEQGYLTVYPQDVSSTISGFDRNVLLVQADTLDGTPTTDEINAYLTQKGREALTNAIVYFGFDGEISQNSSYKYGTDYRLGDMVELQNIDGVANNMRVTEQIFVSDTEGERSYPTLTLYQYINTGSWLSWESDKVWADYDTDTTTVWGTLP
jgi:hypothetical protein